MIKKVLIITLMLVSFIISPAFAGIDSYISSDTTDDVRILKNDLLNKPKSINVNSTKKSTYTVKKGDNLYRIALNHNISLQDLYNWNGLKSDLIYPGDVLIVSNDGKNVAKSEKKTNNQKNVATKKVAKKEKKVTTASQAEPEAGKELMVTATAYTAYCKGCSGTTAYGIDLRSNPNQKVIAVDPRVIPLGTKVWVEGYGVAIAGDTGGAIKGNKIDVFIPSYEDAMEWGVKKIKIKILE